MSLKYVKRWNKMLLSVAVEFWCKSWKSFYKRVFICMSFIYMSLVVSVKQLPCDSHFNLHTIYYLDQVYSIITAAAFHLFLSYRTHWLHYCRINRIFLFQFHKSDKRLIFIRGMYRFIFLLSMEIHQMFS